MKRFRRGKVAAVVTALVASTALVPGAVSTPTANAAASPHTQQAVSPYSSYAMKWTRADAMNIMDQSDPNVAPGANSMPKSQTMPSIPGNFANEPNGMMKDAAGDQVWVWDTWPLTDEHGNQYSYKGWDVIFSLTADPKADPYYDFDDRHVHARIGMWYRKSNADPANDPWIYAGHVFGNQTPSTEAEWSGSTRIFGDGAIKMFYTHLNFADRKTPVAKIALSTGRLHADDNKVWLSGMNGYKTLLQPNGSDHSGDKGAGWAYGGANSLYYQDEIQNPFFSFRDPFTFQDPKYPNKTFMVFEGNTAGDRGAYQCQQSDLGNSGEDPATVTASGANFQMANIGLAVADNKSLSKWTFLRPILSGNCVNDQTERPQFVIKKVGGQWKYYLFTISHAFTYAAGLRGPDGVYGFVGNGIRSDFQPLNQSGLALGNPTDLNLEPRASNQNSRAYQAYSHYVMPGGYVESFIDTIGKLRGGTLAPTVKMDLKGAKSSVDYSAGDNGLLPYGWIPSNIDISPAGGDSNAMVKTAKAVKAPN